MRASFRSWNDVAMERWSTEGDDDAGCRMSDGQREVAEVCKMQARKSAQPSESQGTAVQTVSDSPAASKAGRY